MYLSIIFFWEIKYTKLCRRFFLHYTMFTYIRYQPICLVQNLYPTKLKIYLQNNLLLVTKESSQFQIFSASSGQLVCSEYRKEFSVAFRTPGLLIRLGGDVPGVLGRCEVGVRAIRVVSRWRVNLTIFQIVVLLQEVHDLFFGTQTVELHSKISLHLSAIHKGEVVVKALEKQVIPGSRGYI